MLQFESPLWFLALPAIVPYLWWLHQRSYAQLKPWARRSSLLLRGAVLLLLVAALAQPTLSLGGQRGQLVIALDVSASVSDDNLDAAIESIDRLARSALEGEAARISLIAFGASPRLIVPETSEWEGLTEQQKDMIQHRRSLERLRRQRVAAVSENDDQRLSSLDEQIARIEAFSRETIGERTDLEAALRLAINCGDTDRARSIVVYTDGNENAGKALDAIGGPPTDRPDIRFVLLDRPGPPEVAAVGLVAPPSVRVHEAFSVEIRLASTIETTARVRAFKDGFMVMDEPVQVTPGETLLPIPSLYFDDKGFHELSVTVAAENDTTLTNNAARTVINVPGKARVLYIDGDEGQSSYLKTALELEGISVEARPAGGVPTNLSELLSYDAFILSNVPAERLSMRQMQMVRSYVRDFGGGFIMLGGDESFGLGGYYATPIEETLPVRMPIQKDLTRPSLALVLVIDKSGSMEGVKMQLAKRAAIATAEAINPRDQLAVVGFDGQSRIILELTPAADLGTISSSIAALDAGGGTFLYPALEDAQQRLLESPARKKHVIVLSDGQTQGYGYDQLVASMAADGVTVSTIGIGEGADMRLMEAIAMTGGGRTYFTNDFFAIPQIFTREALRAGNNMLVEELIEVIPLADDPALREIDADNLPLLTGYVATTARPAAETVLISHRGDPILARWRYGLGRAAAFTSETKPRWAEDWISWPDFAKFWGQLVRSITGEDLGQRVTLLSTRRETDDGFTLTADIQDDRGDFVSSADLTLTSFPEDGLPAEAPVEGIGPGLYEATFPRSAYGKAQRFVWRLGDGDSAVPTPYAFVDSYSPEYQSLGAAAAALREIGAAADCQVAGLNDAEQAPLRIPGASRRLALWPTLALLALLMLPIDLLVRRIG